MNSDVRRPNGSYSRGIRSQATVKTKISVAIAARASHGGTAWWRSFGVMWSLRDARCLMSVADQPGSDHRTIVHAPADAAHLSRDGGNRRWPLEELRHGAEERLDCRPATTH